ncbi:MAG TPA: flavin reductase family protein [Roseiflexaceae bacterium]|nr:flavin reductase family protein [Roseiflexaceae bacterium]
MAITTRPSSLITPQGDGMNSRPAIDPRQFRATMGRFATGVTVVTTAHEEHAHGMTANAFLSVSLDPPLVLVSVDRRARLNQHLALGARYGVNILSEKQESFSQHFAGRPVEGLHIPFVWMHGTPLIEGCVAHIVAEVVDIHPAGDHTLYIGHVEYLKWWEKRPLLFYSGQYKQLVTHYISDDMSWFAPQ